MSVTPDYKTLGKLNPDAVKALAQSIMDAQPTREELRCAYDRIKMLEADLLECREFLEEHVDVIDGSDGPMPNRAMELVSMIDESLHGVGF
jgi:hypothetical protein